MAHPNLEQSILDLLVCYNNDAAISGREISTQLNVNRKTVNKTLCELEAQHKVTRNEKHGKSFWQIFKSNQNVSTDAKQRRGSIAY